MNQQVIKYIECACGHTDHVIRFGYFPDDDLEYMRLYVHTQLPRERWYKRLWLGIRYIFGYQCKYGHWGETVLDSDGVNQLSLLISDYIRAKHLR